VASTPKLLLGSGLSVSPPIATKLLRCDKRSLGPQENTHALRKSRELDIRIINPNVDGTHMPGGAAETNQAIALHAGAIEASRALISAAGLGGLNR
jgi:hypothetical protein